MRSFKKEQNFLALFKVPRGIIVFIVGMLIEIDNDIVLH